MRIWVGGKYFALHHRGHLPAMGCITDCTSKREGAAAFHVVAKASNSDLMQYGPYRPLQASGCSLQMQGSKPNVGDLKGGTQDISRWAELSEYFGLATERLRALGCEKMFGADKSGYDCIGLHPLSSKPNITSRLLWWMPTFA